MNHVTDKVFPDNFFSNSSNTLMSLKEAANFAFSTEGLKNLKKLLN